MKKTMNETRTTMRAKIMRSGAGLLFFGAMISYSGTAQA